MPREVYRPLPRTVTALLVVTFLVIIIVGALALIWKASETQKPAPTIPVSYTERQNVKPDMVAKVRAALGRQSIA